MMFGPQVSTARHSRWWLVAFGDRSGLSVVSHLLKVALLSVAVTVLVRSFIATFYIVPSQSMLPNLRIGDVFLASRWDYGISWRQVFAAQAVTPGMSSDRMPDRGDIVVFRSPDGSRVNYVKRVIGLPGDRVRIDGGVISINGRPLARTRIDDFVRRAEPDLPCVVVPRARVDQRVVMVDGRDGCRYRRYVESMPRRDGGVAQFATLDFAMTFADDVPPFVVPSGRMFVMGDNRDESLDSRFPLSSGGLGMVPLGLLEGHMRSLLFTGGSLSWSVRGPAGD